MEMLGPLDEMRTMQLAAGSAVTRSETHPWTKRMHCLRVNADASILEIIDDFHAAMLPTVVSTPSPRPPCPPDVHALQECGKVAHVPVPACSFRQTMDYTPLIHEERDIMSRTDG